MKTLTRDQAFNRREESAYNLYWPAKVDRKTARMIYCFGNVLCNRYRLDDGISPHYLFKLVDLLPEDCRPDSIETLAAWLKDALVPEENTTIGIYDVKLVPEANPRRGDPFPFYYVFNTNKENESMFWDAVIERKLC